MVPRYLCKFDDAVHVSEHELGDVDCELTIDFRPLVPSLQRGEAELLLAFVEVRNVTLRTNDGGVSALLFIRRVPYVGPGYLCKFDDAIHVNEHVLLILLCRL